MKNATTTRATVTDVYEELEAVATASELDHYATDETGALSLGQHRSIIEVRLSPMRITPEVWEAAFAMVREVRR